MENAEFRRVFDEAAAIDVGGEAREKLCRDLATAFRSVGKALWVGGYLIGPDRAEGQSPFEFGSDASVGLAIVVQVAGELCSAIVQLLEADNSYAAAALLRQMVEVEYLAWAFAEDEAEAAHWLRSTKEERLRLWQPRHLRDRSQGRFRGEDYARHREEGGHPTPSALSLLPEHTRKLPLPFWWLELATHAASTWEYVEAGANRLGYGHVLRSAATSAGLPETLLRWRDRDQLGHAAGTFLIAERAQVQANAAVGDQAGGE